MYASKTREVEVVASGRIGEARRYSTNGPQGCGQDVPN